MFEIMETNELLVPTRLLTGTLYRISQIPHISERSPFTMI